jgi:hypothetical protein
MDRTCHRFSQLPLSFQKPRWVWEKGNSFPSSCSSSRLGSARGPKRLRHNINEPMDSFLISWTNFPVPIAKIKPFCAMQWIGPDSMMLLGADSWLGLAKVGLLYTQNFSFCGFAAFAWTYGSYRKHSLSLNCLECLWRAHNRLHHQPVLHCQTESARAMLSLAPWLGIDRSPGRCHGPEKWWW